MPQLGDEKILSDIPEEAGLGGRLGENIVHFGRVLRAAGLPVGPGQVLDAINAVLTVGLGSRDDFYWTLHAVLVKRQDQREIFDQAFHIFWRNPDILERMMRLALPDMGSSQNRSPAEEISRRVAEALSSGKEQGNHEAMEPEDIELDAAMTWSANEVLATKDFEKMSSDEVQAAIDAIQRMRLPLMNVPTRRYRPNLQGGRTDLRRTLRAALRSGSDYIPLQKRSRRMRHPPLVIMCDISGSMERYSRMLLHFMHAVTNDRDRVHTFLFGTRLTNVTRYLRDRDVDAALEKVSAAVDDWAGGTRIGHCIGEFNKLWSRRVLAQGAVVLLISDGLDRDEAVGLGGEMERLHKSCRRLIWLNPLLRYEDFQPKSVGIRAILPQVDELRAVHNLSSLAELTAVLSAPVPRSQDGLLNEISAAM